MNMEEQLTTPVEVTPDTNVSGTEQTVETNTTEVQQPETASQTEGPEVREQNNWNNGRRRIQQRQSMKARIRELEARLAQYEGKDDDQSKFYSEQIKDRIDDLHAMDADNDATALADHASQFFGEDTDAFMQNVYRYAEYVNNNEPDLLKYTQRQYGPILLHEWMQRMDNPNLRNQWFNMTMFEKSRTLDNLYNQIGSLIKKYNERGATAPAKQNVPVPAGGRQTPSPTPSDDFGIEFGNALNRHRQGHA